MPLNTPPRSYISSRLLASFYLVACCLALAAAATGAKAWADSNAAIAVNDSAQLSVAAPVQMRAELDPASGEVSIESSEVQNNGTSDVLMESAAFSGAEGVSGTWTVGVAGASVALGADGVAGSLGGAEVKRGTSAALDMSTTFSGFAAGKMIDKSLGTLTLAFKEKIETFAVFSADDGSLTFYKRGGKPKAGDMFCGKTATDVYEGFEDAHYSYYSDRTPTTNTPWFPHRGELTSAKVADGGIKVRDLTAFFSELDQLATVDIAKLDTSECVGMHDLFYHCSSLRDIDLKGLDASKTKDASDMFHECSALEAVDIAGWNTESCTCFAEMFGDTTSLKAVNGIENLNVSNCTDFRYMFRRSAISDCDLTKWDVSKGRLFTAMFYMTEFWYMRDVEKWDMGNAENCDYMLADMHGLQTIDLSSWRFSPETSAVGLLAGDRKLTRMTLSSEVSSCAQEGCYPTPAETDIEGADGKWYDEQTGAGYSADDLPRGIAATYVAVNPNTAFAVYSADDGSLDFYKRMSVPAAGDTFEGKAVTEVYTGFETKAHYSTDANSRYPSGAWYEHRSDIKSASVIDDGIRPTYMNGWFAFLSNCSEFNRLDRIDYGRCESMNYLFYACHALEKLDLRGIEPTSCTMFGGMFESCTNLKAVDLSGWHLGDQANIAMWFLFAQCTSLSSVDLTGWNTAHVNNLSHAFFECTSLENLDMSSFASRKSGAIIDDMLTSCIKLRTISVGSGWLWGAEVFPTPSPSHIDGADGKWYAASDGTAYSPADIPSGKADTYYAVAPSTFAVFSADDGSLDFYNRAGKPAVGDIWQGKSVEAVFNGFENGYETALTDSNDGETTAPWWPIRKQIRSVAVLDEGIEVKSMAYWFQFFEDCESFDLEKLDMSKCTSLQHAFTYCYSAKSLGISTWDTSSVETFDSALRYLSSIEEIDISGWSTSKAYTYHIMFMLDANMKTLKLGPGWRTEQVDRMYGMFWGCKDLTLDCSGWQVKADAAHDLFNSGAPGVTLPKAWQTAVFAVYSADDASLDFYKRERCQIPAEGTTFERKNATNVYEASKTGEYSRIGGSSSSWTDLVVDTPWFSIRNRIKTAKVVDDGLSPTALSFWFAKMENLEDVDLSKLGTGKLTTLFGTFAHCGNLTNVTMPANLDNATSLANCFYHCSSLSAIDLSGIPQNTQVDIDQTFNSCTGLSRISMPDIKASASANFTFYMCSNLKHDCSNWDVSDTTSYRYFAEQATEVTSPIAWQAATSSANGMPSAASVATVHRNGKPSEAAVGEEGPDVARKDNDEEDRTGGDFVCKPEGLAAA